MEKMKRITYSELLRISYPTMGEILKWPLLVENVFAPRANRGFFLQVVNS